MRMFALAIAAAALFGAPASGFAQSIEIGPGGVRIGDDHGREGAMPQECE